jgi:hypothetical protein
VPSHATKEPSDTMLLKHLTSIEEADFIPEILSDTTTFASVETLSTADTLSAQHKTSEWLKAITEEDDEILTEAQEEKVTDTFNALVTQDPEEIKSAVGMVTAYQWKFVEQAEELRSMSVAKIVKETEHPDARIRLKALELLGKVTEVALFTDRVQIKNEDVSDEELDKRIKEKLGRYMGAVDIVDVEEIEVETKNVAQTTQKVSKSSTNYTKE